MFAADQYALLDFGHGRKLERFGALVLDRPSPAAAGAIPQESHIWSSAAARFMTERNAATAGCGQRGYWHSPKALPASWKIEHPPFGFALKPTETGHVGVFPEQAENWDWVGEQIAQIKAASADQRPRILNLFAYSGGSTLAAAAGGAEVVHIDSSKSTVAWARENAELSGLAAAPIRWIVEDAARFVGRELKRGNRYHGIILDPPTYGHGPEGESWQLVRDLPPLLAACNELAADSGFLVLTCHSPGVGPNELRQLFADLKTRATDVDAHDLRLATADGDHLHSGVVLRCLLGAANNP
jgi:23S rRNA (cytosine1962-C5)-methyltransferase